MMLSPSDFKLIEIPTNKITLRAAVEGTGPLVILLHGFPDIWYCWRHQIKPLAQAGYLVVAPDSRGYGGSTKPEKVEAYDMVNHMADLIGIIDHFKKETAVLVGHDWGSLICYNTAALFPKRVSAVAGLSIPYSKRGSISRTDYWRDLYKDKFFYQNYFQEEGVAEEELDRDIKDSLKKIYYSLSGESPFSNFWIDGPKNKKFLDGMVVPNSGLKWMSENDFNYVYSNFEKTGFRGAINRYRNQHRDFEVLPQMGVPPVNQPSCFIGGAKDMIRNVIPGFDLYDNIGSHCSDLKFQTIIPGAGHWITQENSELVTQELLRFLKML